MPERWREECCVRPSTQKFRDEKLSITFEFVGGPNDGKVLYGRLGESSDAERYYLFTNHGAIGQRFKIASPYAVETLVEEHLQEEKPHHFQRHFYLVTDRLEDGEEVWVCAHYLPEAVDSGG